MGLFMFTMESKIMAYPSVRTILSIDWLDKIGDPKTVAKTVRSILEFDHRDWIIEHLGSNLNISIPHHVERYSLIELKLWGIDQVLQTHGVESIQGDSYRYPDFSYCNTGDTYASTVCYDYIRDKFVVTSYGDWIERNDPNGTKY